MCAFLSRPHQANPHLFGRKNLCRPAQHILRRNSSTAGVMAGRPWNYTSCSSRKFPRQLSSKPFLTGFSCLSKPELSNPSVSNFVARSFDNWGFDSWDSESLVTLSTLNLSLQSTEISNLSDFLKDVTPIEVLSFTFVSTVIGIMVAYIVQQMKDDGDSPSVGLVGNDQEGNPRVKNSSSTHQNYGEATDVWLNLSRPSPFFRAVCAKCPSLSSSTAYQYVQKLRFKKPEYQRQCLPTSDGGTVALDWPSHLDICGCEELENIMLLICGTTEGSHEDGIVKFSQLLEQHGYFPIVFNPRGCGGSPLTTPRVFSAADSDDVRLGVKFIAKSRPRATILSIGWGLGANILARYLGEEGSYTPLAAAVCIDNPFDLSAVARPISSSRWLKFDCSLSKGLVKILGSNKSLFQGEKKGYDVSGALAATSVRDFDRAVSRVAHGYETLEEFYLNASSGATLGRVQIPLLCMQHLEDYGRTQASIPHHVFETNVYTMLLVSRPSNSRDDYPGVASEWTHAISLEWLAAVELSMLKGRHPLLSEFSPTIKLQGEWNNVRNQGVAVAVPSSTSGNSYHKEVALEQADMQRESTRDARNFQLQAREVKEESNGRSAARSKVSDGDGAKVMETSADCEEGQQAGEGLTEAEEAERGQVVQLAETVMNVLDVTMPGTLADAQKQQVLKAVGSGETLVTALEEAVPEDVRGKMSTAVSEVVQAQGRGFKMAEMQALNRNLPEDITDRIQATVAGLTGKEESPKLGLDVSSRSGNESRDDAGVSFNTAQSDDPTKQITLGESDKSSKIEKPTSNDETKGTVATKSEGNSEPSGKGQMSSKDPKDIMQHLESESKVGEEKKESSDTSSTASPNLEGQTHSRGDQGSNNQEQPRGSAEYVLEDRKETASGGISEVIRDTDSPSDKIDRREISSGEETDNAKDMKGQVDSERVRGGSKTVEGAKVPKDGEIKPDNITPPNDSDLGSAQSDAPIPKTSVATDFHPPSTQMAKDIPSTEVPADKSKSPDSGSQPSAPPSTVAPSDTSNSPPVGSEASQSDQRRAEGSTDSTSTPPSSQASQRDTHDVETPAAPPSPSPQDSPLAPAPPSPPPQDSAPAPAPPSPPPQDSPPAPANSPPQDPPVPLPSVGETLQVLTGFDDSTQMAVTNVFGVVENVLDQLEKDDPSTEANNVGETSSENMLNQGTKNHEPNAPYSNTYADENRNDQGTSDKQSKDVKLAGDNVHNGAHLQSFATRRQDRNQPDPTSPTVERADPKNGSDRVLASSREASTLLCKNERGYIKHAFATPSHEIEDIREHPQSTVSERALESVHESPAHEIVNESLVPESPNEKRLRVMAAEIDAEEEEAAESLASDQVAADNRASGERKNDSSMVADLVMNALKLEVVRRLGAAGLETLGVDLEKEVAKVAHAVSELVTMGKVQLLGDSDLGGKRGVVNGNSIVASLGSVLGSNSLLGQLLPFGVLAGVVMAALGATYLIVSDDQEEESAQSERRRSQIEDGADPSSGHRAGLTRASYTEKSDAEVFQEMGDGVGQDVTEDEKHGISMEEGEKWNEVDGGDDSTSTGCRDGEGKSTQQTPESNPPQQGKFMGAMAAAMGATAAVASTATSTRGVESGTRGSEGGEQNLVPEIAEKAISIVSPVVPKTDAGELDQERLVAVLTEVGQRGGPLTLIGKAALLWGGLRGAMSLADRLLAFFRVKERPLVQRLLGFVGMALLLWTPVLVPLLPTLLQQWATKAPSGVADAAAGIGLYGAVFILVTIWGRRVRGYDRPLVSYGLQLFSKGKLRLFAGGLATGLGLVSGYYAINWLLGYSQFAWDAVMVTNPEPLLSTILTSWKVLMLVTQSLTMAAAVALVEELLFRAWLQEEIAVDVGYHWAVFLSALAFAVVHWSPTALVGLWFLAVALSGARAKTDGDLTLPIGIHAGIVTMFSVMNTGGLVRYIPEAPTWITGAYAGNPLAGALGTGMVAALAIALYPRQQETSTDED